MVVKRFYVQRAAQSNEMFCDAIARYERQGVRRQQRPRFRWIAALVQSITLGLSVSFLNGDETDILMVDIAIEARLNVELKYESQSNQYDFAL